MAPQKSTSFHNKKTSALLKEDTNTDDKFEQEKLWCIKKLEMMVESGKINSRKREEAIKGMNILKSQNTIKIKKCLFMKTFFGDYKKKIQEDLIQESRNCPAEFKIIAAQQHKNIFLKKFKHQELPIEQIDKQEFFFNFDVADYTLNIQDLSKIHL